MIQLTGEALGKTAPTVSAITGEKGPVIFVTPARGDFHHLLEGVIQLTEGGGICRFPPVIPITDLSLTLQGGSDAPHTSPEGYFYTYFPFRPLAALFACSHRGIDGA